MLESNVRMASHLEQLDDLAPMGFGLGLHIRFAAPTYQTSTFPAEWRDLYDSHSYQLRDPLIFWGMGTAGQIRWSEVRLPDPFGVLKLAAAHGMRFGATVSCGKITSRTLVGVARGDREFTDDEIAEVARITETIHVLGMPADDLTPAMLEALRLLGHGRRHAAAAAEIGISESALKARLSAARAKLGARTTAEALRLARENRLI